MAKSKFQVHTTRKFSKTVNEDKELRAGKVEAMGEDGPSFKKFDSKKNVKPVSRCVGKINSNNLSLAANKTDIYHWICFNGCALFCHTPFQLMQLEAKS